MERTLTTDDSSIGIFWHTHGSGTSFLMIFYAGNMIKLLKNPTIVVVTGHNDLDDQFYKTFTKCSDYLHQRPGCIKSRKDLIDRLEKTSRLAELSLLHSKNLKKKLTCCPSVAILSLLLAKRTVVTIVLTLRQNQTRSQSTSWLRLFKLRKPRQSRQILYIQ